MDKITRTKKSRFLSYVLRHHPGAIGITLDEQGWVAIDTLLFRCRVNNRPIQKKQLDEIVKMCPKQRFAISDDGTHIRANQGHSVSVDLHYDPVRPPEILYHGTVSKFLSSILVQGLKNMSRHHVHLSPDEKTALNVGSRRGKPVLLEIDSQKMFADGHQFYKSTNNVWLTKHVPPQYISQRAR